MVERKSARRMRCLHCGNEVSLLHKLTDAQFCSAEHRQQFYDEQQRLILQRLQASAARLMRYSREAPTVAVQAPSPEAAAPADIAACCLSQPPDAHGRPFSLVMVGRFEESGKSPFPPSRVIAPPTFAHRLSPLLYDVPWAKYNPGLHSFREIMPLIELDRIAAQVVLQTRIRDWSGLSAGRLVTFRRRSALDRRLVFARWPAKPSWELFPARPNLSSPALRRGSGIPRVSLTELRVLSVVKPKFVDCHCAKTLYITTDPLISQATVSWTALRSHAITRQREMTFLDRVFRMRPRSGVLAPSIALYQPIEARPDGTTFATALRPSARLSPADFAFQPAGADKFFRARPRTGVIAETVAGFTRIDPGTTALASPTDPQLAMFTGRELRCQVSYAPTATPVPVNLATSGERQSHAMRFGATGSTPGAPFIPHGAQPQTPVFQLGASGRLFRMRLRSGVADAGIAGLVVSAGDEPFRTAPIVPGTPKQHNLAPASSRKIFHGRPRGPVSRATLALENVAPCAIAVSLEPAIAQSTAPLLDAAPRRLERLFRPKPRGPVSRSESPGSSPQAGVLLLSATVSPAMLGTARATVHQEYELTSAGRLHGNNACEPVAGTAARLEQVPAGKIGFVSQCAYPALLSTNARLEPAVSSRIFRSRPRSGLTAAPLAGMSEQCSSDEPLISAPAVMPMKTAECVPDPITRPFHMRPRAGVVSSGVANFANIRTEPQSVEMRAAAPAWQPSPFAGLGLPPLDRMYRMRPRAGIAAGRELVSIAIAPQQFPSRTAVAHRVTAELSPAHVTRLFRARMRGREVAPGFSTIACCALHAEGDAFLGVYRLGSGSGPSPAFLNRMYRIRPRPPLDDAETQNAPIRFKHLPSAEPEASLPTLPVSILDAPSPAHLDKLYRMRPRNGRPGAADNLTIDCAPVAGTGTPDVYAGSAGIGSIGGVSARNALQQLTKNWKTIPNDLKAMVMVVPVLMLLSLIPFGAKESSVAHAGTVDTAKLQNVLTRQLGHVGEEIRSRAAIAVEEDFRSGLDRWNGTEGWRETWSIHPSGWVAPGKLALLTRSIPMKDYRVDFSAQIVSRAFGFVVRASDTSNYHAVKFTLSAKPRTVPTMTVVRTLVIAGREVRRNETTVPVPVARDTIYPVAIDVKDQYFTLMIRDKVVDFWSDAQLKSGGIGFFVDQGEKALVHDIKVRYQYDAIGRLVAATLPAER
jgi:hypothetical protein